MSRGEPTTTARGRRAEETAVRFLLGCGYRVVARNFRARGGEVDIVAYDGDVLCFVEVRSRKDLRFGGPAASVTPRKQARLQRAAGAFLAELPPPLPPCRFDVVTLLGGEKAARVDLLKGAFEAGE